MERIAEFIRNIAQQHAQVVPLTLFVAVLCLCLVIGHLGCTSGTFILVLSNGKSAHILRFNEELFFIYLLPPIIFNAGCCRWLFPRLGFLGLTPRDYLAVGAIFSSTDTVCTLQVLHQDETPLLYSLVFGEGVVNEATSVVLFNAIQKMDVTKLNSMTTLHVIGDFFYLFLTSTAAGVTLLELSGILTVFFCGILMSHYAWHNVTESSQVTTSFRTSTSICSALMLLILLGRAGFMFPLSAFSNCMNRGRMSPITFRHQIIMWWAGLMRGAVSIALAYKQFKYSGVTWDPIYAAMVTNTIIVVLFTTMVFGFLTKPLITYMIPRNSNTQNNRQEMKIPKDDVRLPLLSLEESATANLHRASESLSMLMESLVYTIHYYWRKFDNTFMRPVFGGSVSSRSEC
ncbi:hypothetical protein P3X46_027252 [Hevea brasiliensis]|uniref:Cation/H+ exchanger transmembrane domain-containing protein n=1 Tax=Hevea brasiliensis TaxID=3981 RepID=A0ABQ9KZ85_HEVBR|nr:hypothetical protein P3X46_027252 [Hevea brasiliensis]